jgi:hypothetical protein
MRTLVVGAGAVGGLREMHFGAWEGLSWKQIVHRHPRLAQRWANRFPYSQIPSAERFEHFVQRVRREVREIVQMNWGRCVLVVTHAGVIRVALANALGMRMKHLFRIAVNPGFPKKWREFVQSEREYLLRNLARLPWLRPYPSDANFLLVRLRANSMSATALKQKLESRNILIRDGRNFSGLGNRYFRVAVRRRAENRRLCWRNCGVSAEA